VKRDMSIIEQATKRLEEMSRAGVPVPWRVAGQAPRQESARSRLDQRHPLIDSTPAGAVGRLLAESALSAPSVLQPFRADAASSPAVELDLDLLERSGHLVPTQTRTTLAEEFRHIKRPLLKNAHSREAAESRLELIMITSALPREGKTFCAINLAISIAAEVDTSVLLVDADVVRPDVLQRLGIEAQKGLLDLLAQPHLDPSELILRTNVPKLSILPAGTHNRMSTELLASEAMETLLVSMSTRYADRVVIFDAPPLLVTNEAKVLASRVGQVVLVVEASTTPRRAVEQAFAALEQCPIVMSVLNKAHRQAIPGGYGDYYG